MSHPECHNEKMKILLLEDDQTIAYAVQRFFANSGDLVWCATSLEGTEDLDPEDFDLAILDINLPDGNGLEYLHYLRSFSAMPVLMLTVRDSEEDVLKGFREGADDYITKPFSLAILKARAENILKHRHKSPQPVDEPLIFEGLSLSPATRSCRADDRELNLGAAEFDLLFLLLLNQGLCLSREKIIRLLWEKEGLDIQDNTLSVTIKRLREKLGSYAAYLQTARGIGYRWETKS